MIYFCGQEKMVIQVTGHGSSTPSKFSDFPSYFWHCKGYNGTLWLSRVQCSDKYPIIVNQQILFFNLSRVAWLPIICFRIIIIMSPAMWWLQIHVWDRNFCPSMDCLKLSTKSRRSSLIFGHYQLKTGSKGIAQRHNDAPQWTWHWHAHCHHLPW